MGKFHYDQPATPAIAREIFGNRFHSAETVNRLFDCDLETGGQRIFDYTIEQLYFYKRIKPVMFIGCDKDRSNNPITVNWLMKKFPKEVRPSFWTTGNLEKLLKEPSFNEHTCVRGKYYLLHPRTPDERNENDRVVGYHPSRKVFSAEEKILTVKPDEQIEMAIVYVFAAFLHYLAAGEKIYPYDYILCQEKTGDGRRIRVGYFEYRQIYIGDNWPEVNFYLTIAPGIRPVI